MPTEQKIPKIENLDDVVVESVVKRDVGGNKLGTCERVRVGDYLGPEYHSLSPEYLEEAENNVCLIGGKLVYIAETEDGKHLVNINGQEGPKHKRVWPPSEIAGKWAYVAETEDGKSVMIFDGVEGPKYADVMRPEEIGGKLAYKVQKDYDGKRMVVFDGQEGPAYKMVMDLTEVEGELAYFAETEDGTWLLNFNGQEGKGRYTKPNPIMSSLIIDGIEAYEIREGDSAYGKVIGVRFGEKEIMGKTLAQFVREHELAHSE